MTTTLGGHMRLLLATLICCVLETTLVQAQNRELGAWVAEAGVTSFQGGMKDTARLIAGPGPGAEITVRRLIPLGGLALGLAVSYQKTSWTAHIGDYFAGFRSEFTMLELAPELRLPVAGSSAGTALIVHAGPTYQGWLFDTSWRGRLGATAGATLATPLGQRLDLQVRGEVTTTASWVNDQETSAEIGKERMSRWRWSLGLGWHRPR